MSSPLPYIQFFHKEWLASSSVRCLSLAGRGLYKDLLCFQWEDGFIPDNVNSIARMVGADVKEIKKEWPAVRSQFTEFAKGKLRQDRMHEDRESALKAANASRINGSKGGRPKTANQTLFQEIDEAQKEPQNEKPKPNLNLTQEKPKPNLNHNLYETYSKPIPITITEPELSPPIIPPLENPKPDKEIILPWWSEREDATAKLARKLSEIVTGLGKTAYSEAVLPEQRLEKLLHRVSTIDPGGCFASLVERFGEYHLTKKKPPYVDPIRALGDWVTGEEWKWSQARRARGKSVEPAQSRETATDKAERIKRELMEGAHA